jgi:hypothetical protein
MKSTVYSLASLLLISGLLAPFSVQGEGVHDRVKRVEAPGQFSALAIHPTARKLFAARAHVADPQETGLWVFDIDKLGDVTGTDERVLPLLSEKIETPASCSCLRFSPDGRKLYLGVNAGVRLEDNQKNLVVFDLDEKGEPKGKPRSFANGNPYFCIYDILPHPKADVLYSVGFGGTAVYSMPLTKGEPSGEPAACPVGELGKTSIVANETWDRLILGTYPSVIEILDVSSGGEVEKPLPGDTKYAVKAAKNQTYLPVFILGHTLYFASEYALFSWPLDENWQPSGKPRRHAEIRAGLLQAAAGQLYVAHYDVATDQATQEPVPSGFRVQIFKPDENGNPGKPVFESPFFEKAACASMAVDGKTGIAYISY